MDLQHFTIKPHHGLSTRQEIRSPLDLKQSHQAQAMPPRGAAQQSLARCVLLLTPLLSHALPFHTLAEKGDEPAESRAFCSLQSAVAVLKHQCTASTPIYWIKLGVCVVSDNLGSRLNFSNILSSGSGLARRCFRWSDHLFDGSRSVSPSAEHRKCVLSGRQSESSSFVCFWNRGRTGSKCQGSQATGEGKALGIGRAAHEQCVSASCSTDFRHL